MLWHIHQVLMAYMYVHVPHKTLRFKFDFNMFNLMCVRFPLKRHSMTPPAEAQLNKMVQTPHFVDPNREKPAC